MGLILKKVSVVVGLWYLLCIIFVAVCVGVVIVVVILVLIDGDVVFVFDVMFMIVIELVMSKIVMRVWCIDKVL